jgi:hypothetical protein
VAKYADDSTRTVFSPWPPSRSILTTKPRVKSSSVKPMQRPRKSSVSTVAME